MRDDDPDPELRTEALAGRASGDPAGAFQAIHARMAPALVAWATLRIPPAVRSRLEPEEVAQNSIPSQSPGVGDVDAPLPLVSPPTESSWIEVNVAPSAMSVPSTTRDRAEEKGKLTPSLMMAPGWMVRVLFGGTMRGPFRT